MAEVDVGAARKADLSSFSGADAEKAAAYQARGDVISAEKTQSEIAFWGAMLKADPEMLARKAAEAAEEEAESDFFCDNFLCSSKKVDNDSLKQELKMVRAPSS